MRAFLDGTAATVRAGDVAVDIGTDVRALAAARAGARHDAVEANAIGRSAQRVSEANGVFVVLDARRGARRFSMPMWQCRR